MKKTTLYEAMWSNVTLLDMIKLLHITSNFMQNGAKLIVMWSSFDPHDKQNCYMDQIGPHGKCCSTDNICDKYDVQDDFSRYSLDNDGGGGV